MQQVFFDINKEIILYLILTMDFLDRNCGENWVEKRETLGSLRSMISEKDIASIIERWLAH